MGHDGHLFRSQGATNLQEPAPGHHRGAVPVHVCAAGHGQHYLRPQYLHQVPPDASTVRPVTVSVLEVLRVASLPYNKWRCRYIQHQL